MSQWHRMPALVLVVLGALLAAFGQTDQRPGTNAELSKIYTIGKDSPFYFTLKSVEYSATRLRIDNDEYIPSKGEKLLVIRVSVQNPRKEEAFFNWNSIHFTAVDGKNTNYEGIQAMAFDDEDSKSISQELKPAQRVEVFTAIYVPADRDIPKLIVLPNEDDKLPVLRYDLRGKIKALAAPYADPKDKTGITALEELPGKMGEYYSCGHYDLRLDSAAYTATAMPDQELGDGERNLILTVTIKYCGAEKTSINWNAFVPAVQLDDEGDADWNQNVLLAKSNRGIGDKELKPGAEFQFRYYFVIPKDAKAAKFTLHENAEVGGDNGEPRNVAYDLKEVK